MRLPQARRERLLVKEWTGRSRIALGIVAVLAFLGSRSAEALPPGAGGPAPGISVVAEGGSERWIVDLGGVLVAALAPELPEGDSGLLLLVRPPRQPDGPRRLLRLEMVPEPRLELLGEGLSGWIETLAALEVGAGLAPHLVAGAAGRLVDLGAIPSLAAAAAASAPLVERPLLAADGLDLDAFGAVGVRRGVERRVVALEPGRLRFFAPAAEAASAGGWKLAPTREVALPLSVIRTTNGLRLASPPVARLGPGPDAPLLAGPQAVGGTRLRSVRIEALSPGDATAAAPISNGELWASLPGPEAVAQSWPFEIDGAPVLVVRTQGSAEMNLFERQRLRVLTLAPDRTRAGALPTLAVELDSKRWHETAVALGDVDGDGRPDLLAAFPEGLSGSDLVVQWWRGEGGGRFASRAARTDIKKVPAGWELVGASDAAGRPGLLLVGNGRMELRTFLASGRDALAALPALAATIPSFAAAGATRQVTVAIGSDGESAKVKSEAPEAEPLGAAELDRRPGVELFAVQGAGDGGDRLILLRARPD